MLALSRAVGRSCGSARLRLSSSVISPPACVGRPKHRQAVSGRCTASSSNVRAFSLSSSWRAQTQRNAEKIPPKPHAEKHPIPLLRNISIIAHIDAGKTTLTERLLHHTQALSAGGDGGGKHTGAMPGDVDSGSTVTDFLEQERQRGITIQSAAVGPVWWTPARASIAKDGAAGEQSVGITLVDTPGHIDFGIEVERALRVVDGAVVVLDGVEGVESQTENVWNQASRYDVRSLLLFINKLDRVGSSVSHCLRSVKRSGLHSRPLLLQLPVRAQGEEADMSGIVDLLTLETVIFTGKAGETVTRTDVGTESPLAKEAKLARHALVESLASLDDELMDELFSVPSGSGDLPHSQISAASIQRALRRQTLQGTVLPVLCGSAAKNIGVQPLLDAIADYLPSPTDKATVNGRILPSAENSPAKAKKGNAPVPATSSAREGEQDYPVTLSDKRTIALAFKVVHDKRRGPITFIRVYSGTLHSSTVLFNTSTGNRERLSKVLFPFADQYVEASTLRAGQIGVLLGLRDTRTGDTLVDATLRDAKSGVSIQTLRLKRVHVPPPVFSMSLEAASKSEEEAVSDALNLLIRTDPSLRLDEGNTSTGGSSGQTVLSGMGELHLEIAKDRLENEFGVNARMGSVRVSYRETLDDSIGTLNKQETIERDLAGKKIKIGAKIRVRCLTDDEGLGDAHFGGNIVSIISDTAALKKESVQDSVSEYLKAPPPGANSAVQQEEEKAEESVDWQAVESSFKSGLVAALSRGPLTSNPLMGLHVTISDVKLFGDLSSPASISYVVSSLMRNVLRGAAPVDPETGVAKGLPPALTRLMEPMMTTRMTVPDIHLGRVISDITSEQDGVVTDVIHALQSSDVNSSNNGEATTEEQVYIPLEEDASDLSRGVSNKQSQSAKAEVHAVIPLAKLVRYSSKLRALTAGNAQYSMQLEGFAKVSESRQAEILQELGR